MDDIFKQISQKDIKPVIPTGRYIFRNGFHPQEEHISSIMVRVIHDLSIKFIDYHKKLIAEGKNEDKDK